MTWAPCPHGVRTRGKKMAAEPNYAFAKGYGRFGMGYTRLATALGNFEQGNIQAECTVVAQWLTSGLRVAGSSCHIRPPPPPPPYV